MKRARRLPALIAIAAITATLCAGASQPVHGQPRATDGVDVGRPSAATALASAEGIERAAAEQYGQLKREAAAKRALAPPDDPTLARLRKIADRLIPLAPRFNPRAAQWKWEINLLMSKQVNAFCMPGGKIAFFSGLVTQLNLTDDEIAMVMGHEIAHALREHGRERVGKERIAQGATVVASIVSSLLGYGNAGGHIASGVSKFALLAYSRDDEKEADLVGLDLGARAGYDPRAALVLWDKMAAASRGSPPQWLSTHPSNKTRSEEIRKHLKETLPLYARAVGVPAEQLPPYASNQRPPR